MSRFAQSCQIAIKQASEEYWSSSVTKSWATVTYAKQVTMRKGNFVHQRILLHWFSMFCVSRNAYKMIIFAHSKCKRYENRKIQGVALPKKERNGQEWKSSHHGTHHGEQDYGAVLLQVVLHSIALESSCQPIGGQEIPFSHCWARIVFVSISSPSASWRKRARPIPTIRDDTRSPASLRWRLVCRWRPSARCSVTRMWRWRSGMREWPKRSCLRTWTSSSLQPRRTLFSHYEQGFQLFFSQFNYIIIL